jgi:tetratricopeptide (TPR) repeat protein/transcriptional regulator with XRE-family HTH domain
MSIADGSKTEKSSGQVASRLKHERELQAWTQGEVAERIGTTQVNVSRWERGITFPGPYYRQKLGELFGKSVQELELIPPVSDEHPEESLHPIAMADTSATPLWYVPYRRNPFFTGREEILSHLSLALRSGKTAALTQTQAISGLGGIGKTQIAVEYVYRHRNDYQAIFWTTASTREALRTDFAALATLLKLPEQHAQDQDVVVRAVKRWLSVHTRWLLVLDNVDDLQMIVDFLPMPAVGDILLTTRLQALGTIAQNIEVKKMELEEGVRFLLHRSKISVSGTSLASLAQENYQQAIDIFTPLDGLPLALDQAGAYIEETRCGLAQYLDLYRTRRNELLLRRGNFPTDHPESVAATWSLSFQQLKQESAAAAELLYLFAFLNPEAIPEEIITLGAIELSRALAETARDPLRFGKVIESLLRYSLVQRTPEAKFLSIHRLVQAVLKDGMERELQSYWAERAIRAINRAFPEVEMATWELCQRCLPHVQVCEAYIEEYSLVFPEAARLFSEAAAYLVARARYEQAEMLLLRALRIHRQLLEATHPLIAQTLNDLGFLYLNQSKYAQAEILLQEALTIRRQVRGNEHLEVAQTLHNLASLYRTQGFYLEAEPFYLQALYIRETISGVDLSLVAESYYGLARLYFLQEKYAQAEKLCQQALHMQEQRFGNNHPLIASSLNMLARIYQGQQKLKQAKEMNLRALRIHESIPGADHPRVAIILNSLVELYHAEGLYREAEPLIARSLKIHEQALGPEHPYMAYSLNNLADNFFLQGEYAQAEFYYNQALAIRKQKLGLYHPHTVSIYLKLARLYTILEKWEQSESFYQKVLAIYENIPAIRHIAVAATLEEYALLLRKLKRDTEANELEARVQAIRSEQLMHQEL